MNPVSPILHGGPARAGAAGAAVLAVLVVIHGLFLPQYAHSETPQNQALRLIRGSDIAFQWHQDARIEMESARDFPRQLGGRAGLRRNRPVYSAVGSLLYRCVAPFACDSRTRTDDRTRLAAWCLIGTNAVYLSLAAMLLFDATRRGYGRDAAAAAVLLLLTIRFMSRYAAVCVTHVYIHLPAALLLWLAVRGSQEGRRDDGRGVAGAFGWGVLFGLFYLVKQNVAVSATLFGVFLALRAWRSALAYAAGLPLAYAAWRGLLPLAGISYANAEMERYDQGVWLLRSLRDGDVARLVGEAATALRYMPGGIWRHFGWILPLALVGAWLVWRRGRTSAAVRMAVFAAILGACTLAQAYASLVYNKRYIWGELYIVLCPLAGLALATAGDGAARHSRYPEAVRLLLPAALVTGHALVEYNRLTRGAMGLGPFVVYGTAVAVLSVGFLAAAGRPECWAGAAGSPGPEPAAP